MADEFKRFVEIIRALRDPVTGCPWDKEQTHKTIRQYLIEESYELLEAIDNEDDAHFAEELGDVLLQVVLHAQIAADRGAFTIDDVVQKIADKMVRRHPHVFGETVVADSAEVKRNWETIKAEERKEKAQDHSLLAGVPKTLPALNRAQRLGEKAAKVHFDWEKIPEVWAKISEELGELKVEVDAIAANPKAATADQKKRIEHELGDLCFALTQLARWTGVSAEDSLRTCCDRFMQRFALMEKIAKKPLEEHSPSELDQLWNEAKRQLSS